MHVPTAYDLVLVFSSEYLIRKYIKAQMNNKIDRFEKINSSFYYIFRSKIISALVTICHANSCHVLVDFLLRRMILRKRGQGRRVQNYS